MHATIRNLLIFSAAGLCAGCQTAGDAERGPDRTVAYYVQIESSVPGITVETNHAVAGQTPLTLKVFGDVPGCFHNFGSPEFVLRAVPSSTNEFAQTKVFRTGNRSVPGDQIPGVVFFNMSQPTGGLLIDSIPAR